MRLRGKPSPMLCGHQRDHHPEEAVLLIRPSVQNVMNCGVGTAPSGLLFLIISVFFCFPERQGLLAMENIYGTWVLDPDRQYEALLKEDRKVEVSKDAYIQRIGAMRISFDIGEKKIAYSALISEVIDVIKIEDLGGGQILISGTKTNDLEERPDRKVMVARVKITLTKNDEAEIQLGDEKTLGGRFQIRRTGAKVPVPPP